MKKIISILLVIVMLFGILPTAIFAKSYDGGQPVTGSTTPSTPVIDAIIGDSTFNWRTDSAAPPDLTVARTDEYIWKTPAYSRETTTENEFIVVKNHSDTVSLYSQFYVSYDEDYLYIAYRERNLTCTSSVTFDLNPRIGVGDERGLIRIAFKMTKESHNVPIDVDELSVKAYTDATNYTDASDILVDAKYSHTSDGMRRVYMAELKIDRDALASVYSDVENMNAIGFRACIGSDGGEAFYADPTSSAKPYVGAFHADKGYHIFELTPAPTLDLSTYGQATIKVAENAKFANSLDTIDGTIADGEYTWSTSLVPGNDATDTSFFLNGTPADVEYMNIHAAHKDGYLYIAAEVKDTDSGNGWVDYLYGWLGYGDYTNGGVGRFCMLRSGKLEYLNGSGVREDALGKTFIDKNVATTNNSVTTFEWRYDLSKYDNSEELYFALVYNSSNQMIKFGFETKEDLGNNQPCTNEAADTYPHLLVLADPEVDLNDPYTFGSLGQEKATLVPQLVSPNVNGSIEKEEYSWSYKAVFANDADDSCFFLAGTNVTDADKATAATYYISSDSKNVYFALALEDTAYVGAEALYLTISNTADREKYVQYYIEMNGVEVLSHGANKANSAPYYNKSAVLKKYDSTEAYCGTHTEFSVSRAKLMELLGVDSLDKILVTLSHRYHYADSSALATWGFVSDELEAAGLKKHPTANAYPHRVILADSLIYIPEDPFDLGEFGQNTLTLNDSFTPLPDGKIDDGEYEVCIPAVLENDNETDSFFIFGDHTLLEAEYVNFYIAADDDNVYFAVAQKDPKRVSFNDAMYLQIGVSNKTNEYIQIYLPYDSGRWPEILTESDRTIWDKYYSGYGTAYSGDMTYYELAVPRAIIEEKLGVESLDKILVSIAHRVNADGDAGNVMVTWGFKNDLIASVHPTQEFPSYGYPHVIEFYTVDEDEEELPDIPETPTPECTHNFGEWTVNAEGTEATRACSECGGAQSSEELTASGTCGEGLVWIFDEDIKTLTVVGEGAMLDYTYENDAPWYAYRAKINTVIIASGVTSVGDYAFWSNYPITNVTLAASVKSIGKNAFCGAKIENVELPEGLESIEDLAFQETALTDVEIPSTVTSIGTNPFLGCDLETVTVAEGNTVYTSADNCIVEAGTVVLGTKNSTIPSDATAIGYMAFARSKIASVNVPASIESIDSTAFALCESLTAITVDAENTNYRVSGNCLISISTNSVVKGFSDSVIPEDVTSIEKLAFLGCDAEKITVPEGVERIGALAFAYCDNLNTVELPASITNIDEAVFMGSAVTTVNYMGIESKWTEVSKSEYWSYGAGEIEIVCQSCTHTNTATTNENVKAASCAAGGSYEKVVTCNDCGEEVSRETVATPATGHTPAPAVKENVKEATCTADGSYDEVIRCVSCGTELSRDTVTTEATGHSVDSWTKGETGHLGECTGCGETVNEDHNFENGECKCGETEGCDHEYGDWTELDENEHTHECSKCGESENASHNWTSVTTEATCTKEGQTVSTCDDCGATKTDKVPKKSHEYDVAVDVENGYHRTTCKRCLNTVTEKHNFTEAHKCLECGAEAETIFDLGGIGQKHTYVEKTEEAPSISGDSFEADKYTEIASVIPSDETTNNKDFFWTEEMQLGKFKLYLAYDENTVYLAAEVSTDNAAETDTMTFSIRTVRGGAVVTLDAGKTLVDSKGIVKDGGYNVFTKDNGSTVIYAVEIDREALAAVKTMADGDTSADTELALSVEYKNSTGSATYGVNNTNDVTNSDGETIAEANTVVGHVLSLGDVSDNSNKDVVTEDDGQTNIEIEGSYVEGEADKMVSVKLAWEGTTTFTYTAELEWSTEIFQNVIKEGTGKWSTEPLKLTLTNLSNQQLTAGLAFNATVEGVTGKFTSSAVIDGGDENATVDIEEIVAAEDISKLTLESASPAEGETVGTAKSANAYFYVTGGKLSKDHPAGSAIGNVTITISTK